MAITVTLVRATDYRLFYAIDNDGGGATYTITNATLQADAAGKPHLLKAFQTAVADDAAAVLLLMAGVGTVVRITWGTTNPWHIDAQEDGGGLAELILESGGITANNGLLEIQVTSEPMFRA
jgi:hypothetical protein